MPMPTVAEPFASTIALDLTARQAFHAKMRFVISSSVGRSPDTSCQSFATDSMSSGNRSASCSSSPPETSRTSMRSCCQSTGSCSTRRFFFSVNTSRAAGSKSGATIDLGEDVAEVLRHLERDGAVRGDDAAERRDRVALVRAQVGARDRVEGVGRGDGDAARVRVLDDRDRGLDHVERGAQRGIRVDVVVVRHLLALQLGRLGDAVAADAGVDRGALVRVLAVAQRREPLRLDREVLRQVRRRRGVSSANHVRDGAVVLAGVRERAGGELAALRERRAAAAPARR